ncbi:MAG: glycerol-3-phosphate 1-O-acyltransferase PlsY [Thiotrichales bacterium]|nr:glycerol-3-phosphate 1-O-acyltransferase PlsY [Thiotrichales bacterium]
MQLYFDVAIVLSGYLCGSVASAVVVSRLMGLTDPRSAGSGNPGATNVLRVHGKKAAIFTLAGDVIKGLVPVLIARWLQCPDVTVAATALAAFMGHLFPVFFGFKGGKGVATLIGVLLAMHWLSGVTFISAWLAMALVFRYSSLAALVASLVTPVAGSLFLTTPLVVVQLIMVSLLFWRHRSNIRNLIAGTEDRIGNKD